METIMPVLSDSALTIAAALLSLLCAFAVNSIRALTAKLRAESSKLEAEELRELADEAIGRVDDMAAKAVKTTEQTVAAALREQVKAGYANQEELLALGRSVCAEIKANLHDDFLEALRLTVGDVEAYIKNTVEAKVYELKQRSALLLPAEFIETE